MPSIHIRDIPEDLLAALKQRAARNERSLQKELRHILFSVIGETPAEQHLPPIRLKYSTASCDGDWSREEIYSDDGR